MWLLCVHVNYTSTWCVGECPYYREREREKSEHSYTLYQYNTPRTNAFSSPLHSTTTPLLERCVPASPTICAVPIPSRLHGVSRDTLSPGIYRHLSQLHVTPCVCVYVCEYLITSLLLYTHTE